MPRFVILEHDFPKRHWDFMLETEGVLRTWRSPQPPSGAQWEMAAEALADHRLAYLDYEGPVSGKRGTVTRWDRGEYDLETCTDKGWTIQLQGGLLRGLAILEKMNATEWRFRFQSSGRTEEATPPARWVTRHPAERRHRRPMPCDGDAPGINGECRSWPVRLDRSGAKRTMATGLLS